MTHHDLLAPYEPTDEDPFDLRKAGHLARRVGLGASLRERHRLVHLGPERALRRLLELPRGEDVDRAFEDVVAMESRERVRAYRVWRLLAGKRRLAERMSLLWHGHFATSDAKVANPRLMARQLAIFDRLGLGRFDDLVRAVARDPAMVRFLDNDTNVAGRPNENFARELFELFTLGRGHYTERDVREAARAFTGWRVRGERFTFVRRFHDGGEKEVLGVRGRLGGEDVVRLAVRRPESARFVARKLLQWFVHPEPAPAEVEALAECYTRAGRRLDRTLWTLLRSRLFYSPRAYRSTIKSPADFVVGLVRSLGATAAPSGLGRAMARMGQALLEPPTVEGWHRHTGWLSSATWLLRANFAAELFAGHRYRMRPSAEHLLAAVPPGAPRAEMAIELLLDGDVSGEARHEVVELAESPAGRGAGGAGAILHLVTTLPEAQLL